MEELLRTNDLVLISAVEAMLAAENLRYFVADGYMSALEGSVGFLPRRVLVHGDDIERARLILIDAGYAAELRRDGTRA